MVSVLLKHAALVLFLIPATALGQGKPAADATPPAEVKLELSAKVRTAGQVAPLPGSAKPYAEAKKALGRGQPAAALKALKSSTSDLFADREALHHAVAVEPVAEAFARTLELRRANAIEVALKLGRQASVEPLEFAVECLGWRFET